MSSYPSKRDTWIMAILWAVAILFAYACYAVWQERAHVFMKAFATLFFAVFTVGTGFIISLAYKTRYLLDQDKLTICVGPFKAEIPLSEITAVYPSKNPLSAPAWSLDRIRIRFTSSRFGALISPDPKHEFLAELDRLAPNLERRGDRLVCRDT